MTKPQLDAYASVQQELDEAMAASDPTAASAACRRAQLALARVAAGPGFDPPRHRAIAAALRDRARGSGTAPIAPLTTLPLTTR